VLPGAGWVLLHCVVTGGLLAFVVFGGEPEPNGPTRALSAAVYVLFWLVMLSGVVALWSCLPVARASRSGARRPSWPAWRCRSSSSSPWPSSPRRSGRRQRGGGAASAGASAAGRAPAPAMRVWPSGHRSSSTQRPQAGERKKQQRWPCSMKTSWWS
jgi:hypothetical protein